jgi:heptosyltransferase-2
MAMPGLQSYRRRHPDARLVVLAKPRVRTLWELHETPDEIMSLGPGLSGMAAAVRALRALRPDRAYTLTPSIRSALIAFLAGIPERVGEPGHPGRRWLLTRTAAEVRPPGRHQAYDHLEVLGGAASELTAPLESPRLIVSEERLDEARELLGARHGSWIGIFPGAARGPSKMWPAERFIELGRRLIAERGVEILVLGAGREKELCRRVAEGIGDGALDLGGRTPLTTLAALLRLCDAVVANDSGGMHVAAALGTPVVAIFGLTDPVRTGPTGGPSRVLQAGAARSSTIDRFDERAREALEAISTDQVHEALGELLEGAGRSGGARHAEGGSSGRAGAGQREADGPGDGRGGAG